MTTTSPSHATPPASVEAYFTRSEADPATAIDLFTDDAVVVDGGHTHRGRDAVLGWLTGAASEFTTTSTRLSVETGDGTTVVAVRIEGDFPGGVVDLRHVFTAEVSGLIRGLTIAP